MEPIQKSQSRPWWNRHPGMFLLLLLTGLLVVLFARSFVPGFVLFSNDGPLGAIASLTQMKWSNFFGGWLDLNSIGYQFMGSQPSISQVRMRGHR